MQRGAKPGSKSGGKKKGAAQAAKLERDIERREADLKEVEALLADPDVYADAARTKELLERYESAKRDVDGLWAALAELEER